MSDSILYLAIVGIWAGFLIPAWVRRPHTPKSEFDAETGPAEAAGTVEEASGTVADEVAVETAVTDFVADIRADAHGRKSEYRYDVHMHSYRAGGSRPPAEPGPRRPAPGPSQSRRQMMRARRRIMTILTSLVFITAAFVASGLVKWWICVPPVGLLVLYVLLLREIAMADAQLARKRAAWEARVARDVWRRAHRAWEEGREAADEREVAAGRQAGREATAGPTAEIIDISSRVGDQIYDQYADAAVRAVGD